MARGKEKLNPMSVGSPLPLSWPAHLSPQLHCQLMGVLQLLLHLLKHLPLHGHLLLQVLVPGLGLAEGLLGLGRLYLHCLDDILQREEGQDRASLEVADPQNVIPATSRS